MKTNLIWIDEELDCEENRKYAEIFKSFNPLFFNIRLLKNLDEAIQRMKYIDMCFAPKIIIVTRNKKNF